MRTKALLCAAALVASAAISMAQSNVYSLNIVGYANVSAVKGFTFMSNPLDAGVTNGANEVIPNTGTYDFCEIHQWTGVGYKVAVFDSSTDDTSTGFIDRNGNPVPPPLLSSGVGFLFNSPSAAQTLTFVGNVRVGTNVLTFPKSTRVYATGSPLPLTGGISSTLGLINTAGSLDFCEVQQARVNAAGQVIGFQVSVFDSSTDDTLTGFIDRNGNAIAEPTVKIGEGFFFNNPAKTSVSWTQVLLNN